MRKAIWLLIGVLALFTTNATAAAEDGCDYSLVNGKLAVVEACPGGGTVELKVSSSVLDACVALECFGSGVTAVVEGANCSGSATPDTDGDARTKTACKSGANNTKIEITLDSCFSFCD